MKEVIEQIIQEVERAEKLHPDWPTDIVHAAAIVSEESGELIRAALNHYYEGDRITHVRTEAIQTAATAIRLLKNLK